MHAGNCSTQWPELGITTIAVIVGAFISGSYQWVHERLRRPKLVLDYAETEGKNRIEITHKNFDGIYIRVRLRNLGRDTAKNCLVFLTGIEEVQNGGVTQAPFYDSAPITWAGWSFDPRDVPSGIDYYCDVFTISKNEPGWQLSTKGLLASQVALKDYRGTYRFKLVATAENAEPFKYAIDASYNGDWHNLRVLPERKTKDS